MLIITSHRVVFIAGILIEVKWQDVAFSRKDYRKIHFVNQVKIKHSICCISLLEKFKTHQNDYISLSCQKRRPIYNL